MVLNSRNQIIAICRLRGQERSIGETIENDQAKYIVNPVISEFQYKNNKLMFEKAKYTNLGKIRGICAFPSKEKFAAIKDQQIWMYDDYFRYLAKIPFVFPQHLHLPNCSLENISIVKPGLMAIHHNYKCETDNSCSEIISISTLQGKEFCKPLEFPFLEVPKGECKISADLEYLQQKTPAAAASSSSSSSFECPVRFSARLVVQFAVQNSEELVHLQLTGSALLDLERALPSSPIQLSLPRTGPRSKTETPSEWT